MKDIIWCILFTFASNNRITTTKLYGSHYARTFSDMIASLAPINALVMVPILGCELKVYFDEMENQLRCKINIGQRKRRMGAQKADMGELGEKTITDFLRVPA